MTLPVRKSLHDAVLQASKADTWEQATKEWNEVSLIFNGIGRSNCVCGNAIKYAYELFNGVTGQRLFPIGSDCVRHFHRLSLDQQLESDDQLYLVKLGKEKIDYEQELRIQAEKERKKRDKIAKQYADNLVLAMGPAERAYQDYFGFTETLTQEERKWEKILFGKNRAERAIKAKQYQKELEKDQRIASQDPIERKQKQTWLLNSYFRELPEEKARFSRLLLEYRKNGEVPFSTEYLSDHLIDFFYKMKAFEFEIAPEQVRDFLKKSLQEDHRSSAQGSWIEGILLNCLKPFLERLVI
ncbi:hypothetical protein ACMX2X_06605 [Streptococcus pneumoniae]|uniref:hypothetical protein n=1 Tax=Streptococcus pneumoniae TaxID=1313 RepID=UPI0039E2EBE7